MKVTRKHVAISVGILAAAAAFIAPYEGLRTKSYRDVVGVWTVCYGHTGPNVKAGQTYTPAQCRQMLADDLPDYAAHVERCIHVPLTDGQKIALISLVYNVGPGAICGARSSIARNFNAGRPALGCKAILLYDHAGGRKWRGLTIRREDEYRQCMEGVR